MEGNKQSAVRHRLAEGQMTMELTGDGRLATLFLPTETAPTFPLEIDTSKDPHALIGALLAVAQQAGQIQDVPQQLTDKTPVDAVLVPTTSWGVNMGPPGYALLVVRVGTVDLGLQIESSRMHEFAQRIAQLATVLGQEPSTAQ